MSPGVFELEADSISTARPLLYEQQIYYLHHVWTATNCVVHKHGLDTFHRTEIFHGLKKGLLHVYRHKICIGLVACLIKFISADRLPSVTLCHWYEYHVMLDSLLLITQPPWFSMTKHFIDYVGAPISLQQLHDKTSSSVGGPQFISNVQLQFISNGRFNYHYTYVIWLWAGSWWCLSPSYHNVGFDHGLPCCVKNMARGTQ